MVTLFGLSTSVVKTVSHPLVAAFGFGRLSQRTLVLSVRVTQQIESAMRKRWTPVANTFFGGTI